MGKLHPSTTQKANVIQSHIIDVAGTFAGAAIDNAGTFRFIAVDPRVEELDGSVWPSLPDVRRVVGHLLITGRLPAARVLSDVIH